MALIDKLQSKILGDTADLTVTEPYSRPVASEDEHDSNYFIGKVLGADSMPDVMRGGSDYIHLSSLIGMCERREILKGISGESTRQVMPAMRIIWALGRAAENHVRTSFISSVGKERVLAAWVCKCGGLSGEGEFVDEICPKCMSPADRFREMPLWDHNYMIVGNPDLIYIRPDNMKKRVVEIKSIAAKEFDLLEQAKPDHIIQAASYQRMASLVYDTDDEISVVYVAKDFRARPYKEFHVRPSGMILDVIDSMWDKAGRIRDWKAAAKDAESRPPLPDRLDTCNEPTTSTAKNCDQCVGCFARD